MDGGIHLYLISPCIVDFLPFMMINILTKYLTMNRSSYKTSSSSQRVHTLRHLRSGAFNQSTGKTNKSMHIRNCRFFNMLNADFLYQGAQNIFVFQLSLIYIDANSSLFSDKTTCDNT